MAEDSMNVDVEHIPPLVEALVAQAPDAVIFADATGTIRVWNAAAARIFGFMERDALGANLDIIIPERLREGPWAWFQARAQ